MSENRAIIKNHYSCELGYLKLSHQERPRVRRALMEIFNVKRARLYSLIKDYYNIPHDEKIAVEELFAEYNIKPEQLWIIWNDSELTPNSTHPKNES